jgi:hypothetical protein
VRTIDKIAGAAAVARRAAKAVSKQPAKALHFKKQLAKGRGREAAQKSFLNLAKRVKA